MKPCSLTQHPLLGGAKCQKIKGEKKEIATKTKILAGQLSVCVGNHKIRSRMMELEENEKCVRNSRAGSF